MEKEVFNTAEAVKYYGISKSHLYKLVHFGKITYHKPSPKLLVFKKEDLDRYFLGNRIEAKEPIDVEQEAANYLMSSSHD